MQAQSDIATTEAVLMALANGGDAEALNTVQRTPMEYWTCSEGRYSSDDLESSDEYFPFAGFRKVTHTATNQQDFEEQILSIAM
nr:hypothetical protein [Bacteroidota bacterium]